ncbi:Cobyric acid synthase [compost metagenome]
MSGYEIHAGETELITDSSCSTMYNMKQWNHLFEISETTDSKNEYRREGVITTDGRVFGTYIHGLFHNDTWRRAWLNGMRTKKGLAPLNETFASETRKEAAFNRLAEHVRNHLDMDQINRIIAK